MDSQIQVLEGLGLGGGYVTIEGLAATESPRADPGLNFIEMTPIVKWTVATVGALALGYFGWKWWKGRGRAAPSLTGLGRKRRKSKRNRSAPEKVARRKRRASLDGDAPPKRKRSKGAGHRNAFARAAKACKGRGGDAFRACMRSKLAA